MWKKYGLNGRNDIKFIQNKMRRESQNIRKRKGWRVSIFVIYVLIWLPFGFKFMRSQSGLWIKRWLRVYVGASVKCAVRKSLRWKVVILWGYKWTSMFQNLSAKEVKSLWIMERTCGFLLNMRGCRIYAIGVAVLPRVIKTAICGSTAKVLWKLSLGSLVHGCVLHRSFPQKSLWFQSHFFTKRQRGRVQYIPLKVGLQHHQRCRIQECQTSGGASE